MGDTLGLYNNIHGSFNRREIKMLAHALGLPEDRIEQRLNKHGMGEAMPISDLLKLIKQGVFATDINRMFNSQTGLYNSAVFAKALQLIDAHLFSFRDIRQARLAFDVYEMNALRDEKNSFDLILQTIKSCDYHISPLKLQHRLRHYHLTKTKILHLCEYFDLLLISNRDDHNSKSSSKKIIDIDDPKSIDQQIIDELNTKYLREEHNSAFQESFSKEKLIENSVWPAKLAHQHQIHQAAIQKAQLQRQLTTSISTLKQSRAGSACSSPSHSSFSILRQSCPTLTSSLTSIVPTTTNQTSTCSSSRSMMPEIEAKGNEISDRIQQLKAKSSLLAFKYALYREDYMKELFPNGYSKPVIPPKPIERRIKTAKPSIYWSYSAITK